MARGIGSGDVWSGVVAAAVAQERAAQAEIERLREEQLEKARARQKQLKQMNKSAKAQQQPWKEELATVTEQVLEEYSEQTPVNLPNPLNKR
jgi:thiamine biosynthesis lipoprotein ApbE